MISISQSSRCLVCCVSLLALFSCKGEKETAIAKDVQLVVSDVVEDVYVKESFLVEAIDSENRCFVGKVVLRDDVGEGFLAKDTLSTSFYIDIRRSEDGILLGVDSNGKKYWLNYLANAQ